MVRVRGPVLVLAAVLVACGPSTAIAPPASPPPTPEPTYAGATLPAASPEPTAPSQTTSSRPSEPTITVSTGPFPIETSLKLRTSNTPEDIAAARSAVSLYLMTLNSYRDGGSASQLQITGRFRDAVAQALADSATPGVKRRLELEFLRIDRLLVKPWGVRAFAEVTATIVDRVVEGSGTDQREVGRLRLSGDRLRVSDGWDYPNGRWFNGSGPDGRSSESVRSAVAQPLTFFLGLQQWAPGSPAETWRAGEPTPFSAAHAKRLAAIDRTQVTSRLFEDMRATVERFETSADEAAGIATVRLTGTLLTADAGGRTSRAPLERRLKVFLFGGWMPEVVDEEIAPGVWLSGGDLALERIDVNRA